MAATSSRIRIIFEGSVRGVTEAASRVLAAVSAVDAAVGRNTKAVDRVQSAGKSLLKWFAIIGGAASTIQSTVLVVGALYSAIVQIAPAALVLPGIFLGAATAFGVFKLATSNMSEALAGSEKAMGKLRPEAKAVVVALQALAPAFNKVQDAVQSEFFKGYNAEITKTAGVIIPILLAGLPKVAQGFNGMGIAALAAVRSPFFQRDMTTIITNTAAALDRMRFTAASLLSGFVGLGAIGSKFLPQIGAAIDSVAAKFSQWVDKGIETGSIERMINGAIAAFQQLARIVGNVGGVINSVFTGIGAGLDQSGALGSIERLTAQLDAFLKTASAQDALRSLGQVIKALGDAFAAVQLAALKELGPLITALAPFVIALAHAVGTDLVTAISILGPILTAFAGFLSRNKELILVLVPAYAVFTVAVGALRVAMVGLMAVRLAVFLFGIQGVLTGLTVAFRVAAAAARIFLAPLLRIVGIVGLAVIATELDAINVAAAGGDPSKLGAMESTLHNLVGAGKELASGNFSGILADIGVEWDTLVSKFQSGESPAGAAFQKIAASFQNDLATPVSTLATKIGTSFQTDFIDVFASLPSTVGPALSGIGPAFVTAFQPVLDFFTNLGPTIGTAFGDLGAFFATKAQEIWTSFLGACAGAFAPVLAFFSQTPFQMGFAIGSAIGEFITAAINLWNAFLAGCQQGVAIVLAFCFSVPGMITAAIASLIALVVGVATNTWQGFLTTSIGLIASALAFFAAIPGRATAAIAGLIASVIGIARSTWQGFLTTSTSLISSALAFIGTIPGRVTGFLSGLIGTVIGIATNIWNGFRNSTVSGVNNTMSVVAGIPGRIVGAIGNLGGLLVGAGQSLMNGLLAGIRAAVQAVYNFVSGIAAGIAARKGPRSVDRKTLVPAGLALMDGLLLGVTQGASTLFDYVSQVANGVSSSLTAGLTPLSKTVSVAGALKATAAATSAPAVSDPVLALLQTLADRPPPVVNNHFYVDGEQFRGLARTEILDNNREVARTVGAGKTL